MVLQPANEYQEPTFRSRNYVCGLSACPILFAATNYSAGRVEPDSGETLADSDVDKPVD